jgi:succinyl-CoA synthetase beta subunit
VPTLSEAESKALVAAHGIPVPDERIVPDVAAAVAAADAIGYPVVLKLNGDAIAHKTERGLVRLNVADATAVEQAAGELLAAATPDDGAVDLLVAPMLRGNRELIAGLHHDAQFGPTVMLGIGGILAEAVADVAFRLVPLTAVDAEELVEDLRTQALLGEFRGEPAVDRDALVAVITGLAALAEARPDVRSVDLNPLIVVDGRPVAVDALVEVAS